MLKSIGSLSLIPPNSPFVSFGSQCINYGSLFFAYEDFVSNTIRTREPSYSSKTKGIAIAFTEQFGKPLTDYCWSDAEIDLARLVRHTLAHNGGRFGPTLEKYRADRFVDATRSAPLLRGELFYIVNGRIQITPCNTKYLFAVLKDRVTRIVEELA